MLVRILSRNRIKDAEVLLDPIKDYLGVSKALFLSSGRCSLWLILKALARRAPGKLDVIVPAYTCPAVVSAILKAGLRPVLCDINLQDFGYSLDALAHKIGAHTLAVVVVHLFGYPAATKTILEWGAQQGFGVIEDGAQGFGNRGLDPPGKRLGLSGHVGFFSFGRGKPLSALHGGLLVTDSEALYSEAKRLHAKLESPAVPANVEYFSKAAAYNIFLNPRLYWIPQRIPFLHLGETLFEEHFARSRGSSLALGAVQAMLGSVEESMKIRSEASRWYAQALAHVPGLKLPSLPSFPYLRFPLRAASRASRDLLLGELSSKGTGAALFYPCPLNELEGLRQLLNDPNEYPNAKQLAETLITLPVHEGVTPSVRKTIVAAIRDWASPRAGYSVSAGL